jgi:hypothetical protein
MALVAVLWVITLVTLLATTVAAVSVSERRTVQRVAEVARIRETLDSAIRLRLLALTDGISAGNTWQSGVDVPIRVFDEDVRVSIRRESGFVNLNEAPLSLLTAVLAANGMNDVTAQQVASGIVERRRFELAQEVRQVAGAESLADPVVELFTVHSHRPTPDWRAAPPSVQAAIGWAERKRLGVEDWAAADSVQPDVESSVPAESAPIGEVVRVRACGSVLRVQRCRRAILRMTGNESRPIQILQWEDSSPT